LKLNESNTRKTPVFEKILDAKEMYGVTSMSPESVYDLVNSMVCDDELFTKYQEYVLEN
jgi:hypothetical protein